MQRKSLHKEGPEFSRIIAGAWRWTLDHAAIEALINVALEEGITTFDHADIYGGYRNEELFGHVLRQNPSLRKQMEIVTKCGIQLLSEKKPGTWIKHYDTSKEHIIASAENSLRHLSTDHIDLLLIHRPDPLLHPEEVAEAFAQLRKQGKVLHVGVSNFTPWQFDMLQSYLDFPLVTNQLEISLTHRDALFDGSLDTLLRHRVAPMAWSPLGGGKLLTERKSEIFAKAAQYHASETQMALAWLLKHPAGIHPVIGTTKPERIREAAAAATITLEKQDWFAMLTAAQQKEVP